MGLKGCLLGEETLVDIIIIGEKSAIVTQQGRNHLLLVGRGVLQSVQVVATDGKHHAGLVVLLLRVFDITSPVQDLQGRIHLDGEVTEGMTELIDVKLERVVITRTDTYLIEIGQVLIHLSDIVFLGEGIGDTLLQFPLIGLVVE